MKESEKLIERKLVERVKKLGGECIKMTSPSGIPDRICLLPGGTAFFVETKTTKDKARPLQRVWHRVLRGLGFRVEVIDNSEDLNRLIKEYEN